MSGDDFSIRLTDGPIADLRGTAVGDLQDAIYEVFSDSPIRAVATLNGVDFSLSAKYDLADYIDSIAEMLDAISAAPSGETFTVLASNDLLVDWRFKWEGDRLTWAAEWVHTHDNTDVLNERCSSLVVNRGVFLNAWANCLRRVCVLVENSGVSVNEADSLDSVLSILARIEELRS